MTTTRTLCGCAWLALLCVALAAAEFNESLTLRALPGGRKVLSHFHFSAREATAVDAGGSEFPKVLRQILTKYEADALHLTFALGRHSDARYGPAVGPGTHAPFGTRLQVWLRDEDADDVSESLSESAELRERWRGITAELGGVFSASLNQMDRTVMTDVASVDADPSALGAFPLGTERRRFLHAGLAREEICTENLTPWLKMLPCRSHAGLGKLIDPIKFLSGEYLSLSLFASRASGVWELHQQLVSVQTLGVGDRARWSLKSVFFNSLPAEQASLEACPLATESVIYTETPDVGFELQHTPDATHRYPRTEAITFGVPVVHTTSLKNKQLEVADPWVARVDTSSDSAGTPTSKRDLVSVHRFVTGYGQVHGGIAVRLENSHPKCAMRVTYHEIAPWFLRMYYNTFQAKASEGGDDADAPSLIQDLRFVPAEVRGRPNQLHLELELPANSSFVFSIQLEKAFLRLSEHPPDANRGFDVPSGVATFQPIVDGQHELLCSELSADTRAFTRTLYSEPLLVPLPTPDFSMPYNVITMTSTVVAFFVGSMLNTLLRKAPRIKQMMADP